MVGKEVECFACVSKRWVLCTAVHSLSPYACDESGMTSSRVFTAADIHEARYSIFKIQTLDDSLEFCPLGHDF
jgi:hypothetical protein